MLIPSRVTGATNSDYASNTITLGRPRPDTRRGEAERGVLHPLRLRLQRVRVAADARFGIEVIAVIAMSGRFGSPQPGHAIARRAPHSSQNAEAEAFSCWHRGHFMPGLPTAEPVKLRSARTLALIDETGQGAALDEAKPRGRDSRHQ